MTRRKHIILDTASILLYCATIFYLSSQPIKGVQQPFPHSDKLAHACFFGGLCLLVFRFLSRDLGKSAPFSIAAAIIFTALYGISDEVHQIYVPSREGSFYDWVADVVGAVLVVTAWHFIVKRHRKGAEDGIQV